MVGRMGWGSVVSMMLGLGCGSDPAPEGGGTETERGSSEGTTEVGSTSVDRTPGSSSGAAATDSGGKTTTGMAASSGTEPGWTSTASSTGQNTCANGVLDGDETDVDCGGSCLPCEIGGACSSDDDCVEQDCVSGSCLGPAAECELEAVQGEPGNNWSDSYSVDGRCYCDSTFDHAIGEIEIDTPYGIKTVLEICEAIGPGPGAQGHPVYNDIQCGNGPANDAGDEDWCPGRVDQGMAGCCTIGPTWDLSVFER